MFLGADWFLSRIVMRVPGGERPLKGCFAVAYGDALRAPLTGRSPPDLGSASGLSRIRRVPRLRLNRDLI